MELLQLQCDTVLQNKVPQWDANGNYSASVLHFWQKLLQERFPYMKQAVNRIILMFSLTYLCEQSFSIMKRIKSVSRNHLLDINVRNLLIVATTDFLTNFETNDCMQFQKSH